MLLALAGVGVAWWMASRSQNAATSNDVSSAFTDVESDIDSGVQSLSMDFTFAVNPVYLQWQSTIAQAAATYGLPAGLLDKLLYQESHYRSDIVSGATVSPAGAKGIAQFMPATAAQFGINPLDPSQAIPAAAQYLAQLYIEFGSWDDAVAAYNWGPGNVQNFINGSITTVPTETQNYVAAITGDTFT
jgi:soluble lytic murein transglycosylase-like protein